MDRENTDNVGEFLKKDDVIAIIEDEYSNPYNSQDDKILLDGILTAINKLHTIKGNKK